jgi:SAM-dependent methyltransferase
MHISSYKKMESFLHNHLAGKENEELMIYDLGSLDVNGSYRTLFDNPRWQYRGIDMAQGNNVDIVLRSPYTWHEIASSSADIVISGQAFEHIEYFWITILEIVRVMKPGGICCILAPSSGPEHRYPVDCWRFFPDGMRALSAFAQMETLEAMTQWDDEGYNDGSDWWHDTMLVCRKPDLGTWRSMKRELKRWLQHRVLTIGLR